MNHQSGKIGVTGLHNSYLSMAVLQLSHKSSTFSAKYLMYFKVMCPHLNVQCTLPFLALTYIIR